MVEESTPAPRRNVSPFGVSAAIVATLILVPILLSQQNAGAVQVDAVQSSAISTTVEQATAATTVVTTLATVPSSAVGRANLAAEETSESATPETSQAAVSSTADAPTADAPDATSPIATPATASPTTAAPTTAPSTAAPTTAAVPTTAAISPAPTTPSDETTEAVRPGLGETLPVPAGPSANQWAVLRTCESGGNYTIVSSNGLYRGAYQFSVAAWDRVASTSQRPDLVGVLPNAASPADQDALALALWNQRGWAPWPTCGRKAAAAV
ncbi:MAG: hypothetical protein ACI8TP_002470 [Acidimicrobiales bacterium]|jgi:hypothetical protein